MVLFREQELKKTYIQLGNQFKLPKDLILIIYNHVLKIEKQLINFIHKTHICNIYYFILQDHEKWLLDYAISQDYHRWFLDYKSTKFMVPLIRNLECAIKWDNLYHSKQVECRLSHYIQPFYF